MKDILQKLSLILLVLAALVPTMNMFPWFAPPAWGQAVLVRLLVPLLGFLFLARLAYEPGFAKLALQRISAAKRVLAFGALFLLVYALALVFSSDPHLSFWGTPERAWGALNYGLYAFLGFIAFLSLNRQQWKTVWLSVFTGAFFLALIALAQRFALVPNFIDPALRPHATLGNPILLGVFLTPLIFLLLGFALHQENSKRRWGYAALALLFLLVVLFTESRSAFFGVGAGLLFALLFSPLRPKLFRRLLFLLAGIGIAFLVLLFLNPAAPAFFKENSGASRLWERITPQRILQNERFAGWHIELKGIADRPFLGYGPYNSAVGFNKHFEPDFTTTYGGTGWWDTAHNMYLDIATGTGILGLGTFLVFLGVLFWALVKTRRSLSGKEKVLLHGVQTALLGYLVAMVPSFNSPATYLVFFLLLAYALHLISTSSQTISTSSPRYLNISPRILPYLFIPLAAFLLFFLYTAALKPLIVNKEINIAVREAESGSCQTALNRMERSFPANSHFADYHRLHQVEIIGECIGKTSQGIIALSAKAVELERARTTKHPLLPRPWILLGGYLNNLILLSNNEEERNQLAKEASTAFERAKELSPKRAVLYAEWANTKRLVGEYQEGEKLADRCIELQGPEQCRWQKTLTSIASGASSPPLKEILLQAKQIQGIGYQTEAFYIQLVQTYAVNKEKHYPQLRDVYERLLRLKPDNIQYRAALATVYRELGERDKAIGQLNHLWRLEPTPEMKAQIDAFLQTLP